MTKALPLAVVLLVACKDPQPANGLPPCCVGSSSAKPPASVGRAPATPSVAGAALVADAGLVADAALVADVGLVADAASVMGAKGAWAALLAAMRGADDAGVAARTTAAGLASLRAGAHGEPEQKVFRRWGEAWSKWELRFGPAPEGRARASMGPEVKEHGLEFVRAADGWRLDRWTPGD